MNRKNLIIILTVFIFILLGIGAYFYFQKSTTSTPEGDLFPGSSNPATTPIGEGEEEVNIRFTPGSGQELPRLYQLHKVPVSGITSFEVGTGDERTISARYIERGLGHIYETALSTYIESRIVNETRSKISEALWGKNGQSVVVRSLDQEDGDVIKTRIINLGTPTTSFNPEDEGASQSTFIETEEILLPDYIPFMAVAEDGADKIFYLESGKDAAIGTISTLKATGISSVFKSSFTEWIPQFPSQKLVTLTTRPSTDIPGYAFFLDPKTKSVTKVLSDIKGLTTLTSPDGAYILYGEASGKEMKLYVYDVTKKTSLLIPAKTLPEKCVWGQTTTIYCAVPNNPKESKYPDSWYQGIVSFDDTISKINALDGGTVSILKPSAFGLKNLDMTNLTVSSGDEYLLFINKITGTPWVYRLMETVPPVATQPSVNAPVESFSTKQATTPADTTVTEGMTQIR